MTHTGAPGSDWIWPGRTVRFATGSVNPTWPTVTEISGPTPSAVGLAKAGDLRVGVEPGSAHDLPCACQHVLGALYSAASQLDLPTVADPATTALASACTARSSSPPTAPRSTSTHAPTTCCCARCAAAANAASPCSPAAGAPCSASPSAHAKSATSQQPRSFSPTSRTATRLAQKTSL